MAIGSLLGGGIMLILGGIALVVSFSSFRSWNQNRSIEHMSLRDAAVTDSPVSVDGEVRPTDDSQLTSPVNGKACIAYEYRIERRSGDSWSPVDSGSDSTSFLIDDGTAVGYVDPSTDELSLSTDRVSDVDESEIADEVETNPSLSGRRRYYEGTLSPGEEAYVRGMTEGTQEHGDADVQFHTGEIDLEVSNQNKQSLMASQLKKGLLLIPLGVGFSTVGIWLFI